MYVAILCIHTRINRSFVDYYNHVCIASWTSIVVEIVFTYIKEVIEGLMVIAS